MYRRIFIPFFLLLLFPPLALTAQDARIDQVDTIMAAWHRTDSPGCALAVIQDGEIVHRKGYGMANLEHSIPITPETVFYAGSVSKQFVTTSILLLQEQGRISIDDPVQKYFPEIPTYNRPITLRHLIHHTSGLRDYLEMTMLTGRNYLDGITEKEIMRLIARQKGLNFETGSREYYSNTGYFLLAELVKRVSDKTLRGFAKREIFIPLGMTDSHFHDNNAMIIPNLANGYFMRHDGWGLLPMRFALVGSGGLYTTVEDLYKWDQNFYDNRLGKGSQDLIEALHVRGTLNSGDTLSYAFALNISEYRGLKTVSHSGSMGGYRAHLQRFPDHQFTTAFLCNAADINPGQLANQIADVYLEDEMKTPVQKTSTENHATDQAAPMDQVPYERYTGAYYSEELDATYFIEPYDDGLILSVGGMGPWPLVFHSGTEAQYADGRLRFEMNRGGQATGFTLDARGESGFAFVRR